MINTRSKPPHLESGATGGHAVPGVKRQVVKVSFEGEFCNINLKSGQTPVTRFWNRCLQKYNRLRESPLRKSQVERMRCGSPLISISAVIDEDSQTRITLPFNFSPSVRVLAFKTAYSAAKDWLDSLCAYREYLKCPT